MSPKSRGRPSGRGRAKSQRRSDRPVRELRPSDRLLQNAHQVAGDLIAFDVEYWASGWLGQAWLTADLHERRPEHQLCLEVAGRARNRPSATALAAVAALRRVAQPDDFHLLDETIELLSANHPAPAWIGEPHPKPVAAWRAVDIWDSERVLFIDYADAPRPHTLLAALDTVGGLRVETLGLLEPGAAASWSDMREDDEPPMPLAEAAVDDVLAELADALRTTDLTWPREEDDDFVDLRALAWSRCREHLPALTDLDELAAREEAADAERPRLLEEFGRLPQVETVDPDVVRSLADIFLDYGEGYIHSDPLAWSPAHVEVFLTSWAPRKVMLDAEDRAVLPAVLRAWLRFALHRRGIDDRWIKPVVRAVEEHEEEFLDAVDDEASWGPAKRLAVLLEATGIDLTDEAAVQQVIDVLNAGAQAHPLLDRPAD